MHVFALYKYFKLLLLPPAQHTLNDPKVLIKLLTLADDGKFTTTRAANTRQY